MAIYMDVRKLGVLGEDMAVEDYLKDGYTLLCRNYHSRYGEIDIILKGHGFVVFSEVKLRKRGSFVTPSEAVTYNKQCKIIATAEKWLYENPEGLQPRFDVVELWHENGGVFDLRRIENAFGAL